MMILQVLLFATAVGLVMDGLKTPRQKTSRRRIRRRSLLMRQKTKMNNTNEDEQIEQPKKERKHF